MSGLTNINETTGALEQGGNLAAIATSTAADAAAEAPSAASTYSPSASDSVAYVASQIAKASAGNLYAINGYNSKTSSQFIQIHNSATLPADTAVPCCPPILVPAQSNFSYTPTGKYGKYFSNGIVVCNSSTGPTKTIGTTDCWFEVLYK